MYRLERSRPDRSRGRVLRRQSAEAPWARLVRDRRSRRKSSRCCRDGLQCRNRSPPHPAAPIERRAAPLQRQTERKPSPPFRTAQPRRRWLSGTHDVRGLNGCLSYPSYPCATSSLSRRNRFGRTLNRRKNPRVCSATAQVPVHCSADLGLGGLRVLEQQLGPFDDLPVETIAALRGLFCNHRLLQRMQLWSF